ncbi:DUF4012 domain-containing protein [Rhodococcus sp. NPDC003382]
MDDRPSTEPTGAGALREGRNLRRPLLVAGGVVGAAVILWFGFSTWRVYDGLQDAKASAESAVDAALGGDMGAAGDAVDAAESSAASAVDSSESVPWRVLRLIPRVGAPFETVHQIAKVTQGLTANVAKPTVEAGSAFSLDTLVAPGGRIDVALLRDAEPILADAAIATRPLAEQAARIPEAGLSPVDNARVQVRDLTARLADALDEGADVAQVLPAMLGADGPRNYFMAFQTPAEARGTGGLVGGFGVVKAENGVVGIDTLASNNDVPYWESFEPLDLGPDFAATYAFSDSVTTDIRNSNFSSHFPYTGRIWQSLWEQQSGQRVDGAIATDPIALSYVLEAIGPVTLPNGDVIDAGNIVDVTLSSNYLRFADDNNARKQYLQDIAAAVVAKMTGSIESPKALMDALSRAVSENRIAVWSDRPEEQEVLADSAIGHTVADTPAPYAEVVINNHAGNKMDYYLRREIEYRAETCTGDTRKSTVTVRLHNDAPEEVVGYPRYVAGIMETRTEKVPMGSNLPMVSLVATQGARLDKVTVDGNSAFPLRGTEVGHPVFHIRTAVPRGETVEVVFEMTEPSAPGVAQTPIQPLVDTPTVTVDVPVCNA